MTIYVYSNATGDQVASHEADTNRECEQWADENYGSNDYHCAYSNFPHSNAVEEEVVCCENGVIPDE